MDGIKEIININKKKGKRINNISVNGELVCDSFHISEKFNEYFSSIAQKIDKGIIDTSKHYKDYLTEPLQNSFFIAPTDNNAM